MGTALKTIAVLSMGLAFVFSAVHADEVLEIETYSQRDLLKNWALSVCFAKITEDAKTKEDASSTASGYLEFGRQGIEAYDELWELVEKFVSRKYSGSSPSESEFNTMKCIDLFHSAELDAAVTRLVP
jgi:hypothetical protein